MKRWSWIVCGIASVLSVWTVVASADTLVMRNGQRISGRLIGLREGVFEFEEDRGLRRGRVIRVEQADVRTIELDQDGPSTAGDRDRDNGGAGRPRGLREREVNVQARTQWTDTGVNVRNGQMVYFEASGRVRWGRDRQDGPEGENNSPRNPNRPIPGRPAAALIGRVGDDAPFFIGGDAEGVRVRGSGTLFLGINDETLDDNSGSFRVTVYY
ncbi:MAG TPA: hypothetical protein VFO31_22335 [Vicinamibacterales bacterium]|nr:hypothetical protein [Vicinamibacterales bacterium]